VFAVQQLDLVGYSSGPKDLRADLQHDQAMIMNQIGEARCATGSCARILDVSAVRNLAVAIGGMSGKRAFHWHWSEAKSFESFLHVPPTLCSGEPGVLAPSSRNAARNQES
jgi:hypothetical protein